MIKGRGKKLVGFLKLALGLLVLGYLYVNFGDRFGVFFSERIDLLPLLLLISFVLQLVIASRLYTAILFLNNTTAPMQVLAAHVNASLLNYLPLPIGVAYRIQFLASFSNWTMATTAFVFVTAVWLVSGMLVLIFILLDFPILWLGSAIFILVLLAVPRYPRVVGFIIESVLIELLLFTARVFLILGNSGYPESLNAGLLVYFSNSIASLAGVLPGGLGLAESIALLSAETLSIDKSLVLNVALFSRGLDITVCVAMGVIFRLYNLVTFASGDA